MLPLESIVHQCRVGALGVTASRPGTSYSCLSVIHVTSPLGRLRGPQVGHPLVLSAYNYNASNYLHRSEGSHEVALLLTWISLG